MRKGTASATVKLTLCSSIKLSSWPPTQQRVADRRQLTPGLSATLTLGLFQRCPSIAGWTDVQLIGRTTGVDVDAKVIAGEFM